MLSPPEISNVGGVLICLPLFNHTVACEVEKRLGVHFVALMLSLACGGTLRQSGLTVNATYKRLMSNRVSYPIWLTRGASELTRCSAHSHDRRNAKRRMCAEAIELQQLLQ
ncbi:uncharacterized protein K460DRAFT_363939 [Cucurbitaria berberidis CBS 394.84]|uniref:Uncharacterized protein n=1 Tax=Cucurbitaria berberidis CBS 394.84 TaxID=1168544 RepID=A0A9P4GMV4_9PLEO|nr:uncharacterized protein K460DRAFT_363939 [Cucurbitaria berberidis CBS 394.84]KAF1847930.1 hypothetical protein K460DRAFT_363939 [Cucurbitaria berberidis CBS 394.84]